MTASQPAACSSCEDIDPASCLVCRGAAQPQPAAADLPDRCPSCTCENCNGTLAQHAETGCTCEDCTAYPTTACTAFAPSVRVSYLAQALAPLLSAHLNDRAQRRCTAVAHATHHALDAYDYPAALEA